MADGDAYARRLQPIYDAIDARQYKAAAKACDTVLKKYKGDQLARALKAFAVIKCGKRAEGLQLLDQIRAEGPHDDRVLSTMTFGFKAADCPASAITAAYAAAAEARPKDPEALAGLFGCYVREGSYVKQQQVATKLAKLVPPAPPGGPPVEGGGDRYTWWVITSLALQAREVLLCIRGSNSAPEGSIGAAAAGAAGPSLSADKLLTLAATMAERQIERSGGHISYESLLLYLDILLGQGQPDKALELLEGPLGEAAVPLPADRAALRAAAAACAGDHARAAAVWRKALLSNPDDWLAWLLYLDCVLPGSAAPGGVAAAAPSGSRFPVGMVGGLADVADRMRRWQRQRQQGAEEVAAGVAAAEATLTELRAAVEGDDARRTAAAAGSLRTPLLAPLELLLRRLVLAGAAGPGAFSEERQALLQALAEGVLGAYRKLGHTFSCAPDLRLYLAALATSPAQAAWLAKKLCATGAEATAAASSGSGVAGGDPTIAAAPGAADTARGNGNGSGTGTGTGSAAVQQLQRVVNARLLEHELGLPVFSSAAEAEAYASELLDLYERHLPLSERLDEKDRGYGEDLVCMAVAALLASGRLAQASAAASDPGPSSAGGLGAAAVRALLVLEAAQVRRKVSAPLHLASAALYSMLGAPAAATRHFSALDIKHILHDSMTGHWLLPALLAAATDEAELRPWLVGIALLFDDHQKDAGDTLLLAYQHGTYSKVMEFVDFKERLLHSHTRLLGAAEAVAVSLRAVAAASPAALAEAAAAAATKLAADPLAELVVAQPARQTDAEASCEVAALIRFDEDLSTRPCWLPPHSGAARAAVACWWEAASAAAESSSATPQCGFAACWWSEVAAAESRGAAAAAWRAGQLAALQRRWLTPAWLAAALAKRPGAEQLALLQQCSEQWGAAAENASSGPASAVTATMDGLLAALVAAAQAMQAALAALEDSDRAPAVAAASSAARKALSALQHGWAAACELLAVTLVPASGQLPGLPLPANHGPALAGPLLAEEAPFAAACLQAWAGRLAAAGKRDDAAAVELLASVRAAAGSLQVGMEAVALALDKLLERSQAEQVKAAAAALDLFGGGNGAPEQQQQRPLWAFERGLKPVEVVKRLVGEQRETAARLAAAARAVKKAVAGAAAA